MFFIILVILCKITLSFVISRKCIFVPLNTLYYEIKNYNLTGVFDKKRSLPCALIPSRCTHKPLIYNVVMNLMFIFFRKEKSITYTIISPIGLVFNLLPKLRVRVIPN